MLRLLFSSPPNHGCAALCIVPVRFYQPEYRPIRHVEPTSFKRGTGGRSSFNGIVATVFGATGFLGGYVCNRLGKTGTQLILPYRGDSDDLELKSKKLVGDLGQVKFMPFNLRDCVSIEKAVKYSNIVINLIGRHFESKNFNYYDVHVTGARNIARACRQMGVDRLIHFSALNATAEPEPYLLKNPLNFLPSKFEGEKAVREEFPDATIIKPSVMYGHGDKFLWAICTPFRRSFRSTPLWASGEKTIRQPVYVGDVAQGVAKCVTDYYTKGKTYQAIGPRRHYLSDLVDWMNKILLRHDDSGKGRHDVKYDLTYFLKVYLFRNLLSAGFHMPNHNLCFEQIDMEAVTDKFSPELPTLEDLGIQLTELEDRAPEVIMPFLNQPYVTRHESEFFQFSGVPRIKVASEFSIF